MGIFQDLRAPPPDMVSPSGRIMGNIGNKVPPVTNQAVLDSMLDNHKCRWQLENSIPVRRGGHHLGLRPQD